MKFKLLHVRPHVWFFKQKETISKAPSDDSSSEGPYVYKRSTSLKLVKSDPIAKRTCNASKPSANTVIRSLNQGKDVKVCTVVDAGCTCRATVTSQHKAQKKGLGGYPNAANGGLSSLHDVCRPRFAQVFEAREDVGGGSKHDVCRPRRGRGAFSSNVSTPPLSTSNSMVSRLVCKSSHDVVKHSQLDVEHCDVVCKSASDESKPCDARAPYGGDKTACFLDVHQLECRLRDAGLEERRRSSKKKNKYLYEEGSSGPISSSNSTHTNMDSLITCTTTEMQDMLLNANPAFDTDAPSTGDSMLSLEDLRASIAQRKLAIHNLQASLCGKDAEPTDGMCEKAASTRSSPSSLSSGNKVACRVSPSSVSQNLTGHACEEGSILSHADVRVNKKLCFSESNDRGLARKSPRKPCAGDTHSVHNEAIRDDARLARKASRRIELRAQKALNAAQHEVKKSRASRVSSGLAKGEEHEAPKKLHEADKKSEHLSYAAPEGRLMCAGAAHVDDSNGKPGAVSSSSCEIQVLSDYSYEHHSDGNSAYPMIRMHVNGTSLMGAHAQDTARALQATTSLPGTPAIPPASHAHVAAHALDPNSLEQELMRNDSAVAMVKSSYDPMRDFKESMLEMVVAKRLRTPRQLQQLLQCYLSLNPSHYHPTIIKVFHELCSELFN